MHPPPRLFGRTGELEILGQLIANARRGRSAVLVVRGEPGIGKTELLRQLTADWEFEAVGGLTLGADPVATAMMHSPGPVLNAFVVRKEAKAHGMQRRIEGPDVAGRSVLVVEDTTTTGASPLKAVEALREVGADVVGVATIVDRGTGADRVLGDAGLTYRYLLGLDDLGLPPM